MLRAAIRNTNKRGAAVVIAASRRAKSGGDAATSLRKPEVFHVLWPKSAGNQHLQLASSRRWSSTTANNTIGSGKSSSTTSNQSFVDSIRRLLGSGDGSSGQNNGSAGSFNWRLFARVLRYSRIPVVVISVYGLGYQQGIMDDTRNPEQTRAALLDQVLQSVGATDQHVTAMREADMNVSAAENIWTILGGGIGARRKTTVVATTPETKQVARIGRVLIDVAKQYCRDEMEAIAQKLSAEYGTRTKEALMAVLQRDENFTKWLTALRRLEGDWTYMVIRTKVPNAFVSELLPKHMFITTTMLHDHIANVDELGLVLGHELSHLILGHMSERTMMETVLRTMEVLLLSMDPTEGVLSVLVVGGIATLRQAISSGFSREHEREADALGLKLAARACFDTHKGIVVFKTLGEKQGGGEPQTPSLLQFLDTHPPSKERYEKLVESAEEEKAEKYCRQVHENLNKFVLNRT